jgi:hypothetical protein
MAILIEFLFKRNIFLFKRKIILFKRNIFLCKRNALNRSARNNGSGGVVFQDPDPPEGADRVTMTWEVLFFRILPPPEGAEPVTMT